MPPTRDNQDPPDRRSAEERGAGRLPELRASRAPRPSSAPDVDFLLGRADFLSALASALRESQASGRGFAIAVLDVDRARLVHDAGSNAAADAALLAAAARLAANTTVVRHLARLGGGEFAMLLPSAHDEVGLGLALNEIIENFEAPLAGASGPVTVLASAGGCLGGGTGACGEGDAMHLLATAKQEMYRAKRFDDGAQSR